MSGSLPLPEGRAGQALAAGLAAVILAVLWLAVLAPAVEWYEGRADDLAFARARLMHLQMLQASLPALRHAAAGAAAQAAAGQVLLPGASDEIAGANLQTTLQTLANQDNISLNSVSMLPPQPVGALRKIGVSISLAATWPDLIGLLTSIDAASPRMMVDDLSVSAAAQPDPRQDVPLQASFDVSGFRAGSQP